MEVGEKKSRLTWVRGVSRHVETGLRRARTARRAPRSVLTRDRHNGIASTVGPADQLPAEMFLEEKKNKGSPLRSIKE